MLPFHKSNTHSPQHSPSHYVLSGTLALYAWELNLRTLPRKHFKVLLSPLIHIFMLYAACTHETKAACLLNKSFPKRKVSET